MAQPITATQVEVVGLERDIALYCLHETLYCLHQNIGLFTDASAEITANAPEQSQTMTAEGAVILEWTRTLLKIF